MTFRTTTTGEPLSVALLGASRGFGAALNESLRSDNIRTFTGSRGQSHGDNSIRVDVCAEEELHEYWRIVGEHSGGALSGFVYAAGFDGAVGPAGRPDAAVARRSFDVNFMGFLRSLPLVLPLMRNSGSILVIGSDAADRPLSLLATYGASKAALENYARSLAAESAHTDLRVNILRIVAQSALLDNHNRLKDSIRGKSKARPAYPSPSSNVAAARWLLSPESSRITGQTIRANHLDEL